MARLNFHFTYHISMVEWRRRLWRLQRRHRQTTTAMPVLKLAHLCHTADTFDAKQKGDGDEKEKKTWNVKEKHNPLHIHTGEAKKKKRERMCGVTYAISHTIEKHSFLPRNRSHARTRIIYEKKANSTHSARCGIGEKGSKRMSAKKAKKKKTNRWWKPGKRLKRTTANSTHIYCLLTRSTLSPWKITLATAAGGMKNLGAHEEDEAGERRKQQKKMNREKNKIKMYK